MKEKSKKKNDDQMLKGLLTDREAPKFLFVALTLLFLLASVFVSRASRSQTVVMLAGKPLPISTLAGVLSSLSNICIIILVVFYRKAGFYTSLVMLLLQVPVWLTGLLKQPTWASLPGAFSAILIIVAILLIYRRDERAQRLQDLLREQSAIDSLTGLPNRFGCTALLNRLVQRGESFIFASVDLDKFKSINETMGHDAGNGVLMELANRWKALAESDKTGTRDFVSRQDGDEFALIIRKYDTEEKALGTIRQYLDELRRTITVDECDYHLQASVGYAAFPADADTSDLIQTYANVAMNEAKHASDSTGARRFNKSMLSFERDLEIEQIIKNALEQDRVFFHLQPQFDLSHELRGFEVLARMKDANGQMISPVEFIPVAEKAGLVDQIDRVVFRKAAILFGSFLRKTQAPITLSVNVSVQHLMKNRFLDEVRSILEESGVPANQIEIEITESVMIDSAEKALDCITELKRMGLKVAIDDFGTGYSSLSYLQKFPADLLKVDKSFVDEMNTSESSKQYVAAIISIGHIMNQRVIAEGVEEDEQINSLRSFGCDYIQGYVWGRPMMPEDAEKLIA